MNSRSSIVRFGLAVVVAVGVVAGVAGCGSSSDSGTSSGSSEIASKEVAMSPTETGVGTKVEQATGTPIKVLVTAPINSPVGTAPGVLANVEAAFLDINEHGGVNGKPLEATFCNNGNDPNETASCARQAVSEKAVAVIPYAATQGPSLYPSLEKAGIPVVGALPSTPPDWESPVAYPISAGITQETLATPEQMAAHGIKKFGGILIELPSAKPQLEAMEEGAENAGIEFTEGVYHPYTQTNMSPYVQKMISSGAEAISFVDTTAATVSAIKAAKTLGGSNLQFAQNSQSLDETLFTGLGESGANGLLVTSGLPPETATKQFPGIQLWANELAAAKKAGVSDIDTKGSSEAAWIAAHAVAMIADEVKGAVTASSLKSALDKAEEVNLLGLITKWNPGRGPDPRYPRLSSGIVYFTEAQDGHYVLDPKLPEPVNVFEDLEK